MSLRFSLMGPVRAWRDDEEIDLGPRQQRAVLAALLLNNGLRLSNEQLVRMVWDDPTPSAVMALRTYMYKIRKAIPELDLRSKDGGYTLQAEVFDDCRDEPLAGLTGSYFEAHRVRLGNERLRCREIFLERELDVLELQKHVAAYPLREHPRALLMRALYRDGRQVEALEQFHEMRALLNDELGLEPGPELREVHEQILRGELTLPRRPEQLPPGVEDFTGRTAEIEQALRTLPRTVGIAGMHGSGKTALAVHIGHLVKHRFPDGQIFVRGHDVANELLRAVGVENPVGDKAALWREKARGKRFLVVVDDLQDAASVRDLHVPGSGLVLTSVRRWNELSGVTWLTIAGLSVPEAHEFFGKVVDPARTAEEPELVARVLARVSHLPTPIRVLGGKLSSRPRWTVAMLLRQMERGTVLGEAVPSDCRAVLAPMVEADRQLTGEQRHLLDCFARQGAEVVDVCEAARLSGGDISAVEPLMEALADVHLVEPLELGRYRVPSYVRIYFSLRSPALTS
ncbi:DNA-binding transcriptional activator of the SARP family [Lentzea jiangxiensis]|uniref:DNA-binding transcriptional activator of the SARP family n=2 Tax=Lentzea jiangxiensis TaxID=641025 RepID=A0A1H0TBK5_9PSEU|nr:DNA-binding transcriptional activator of the SARP family [Lentzea jiangxiensis]